MRANRKIIVSLLALVLVSMLAGGFLGAKYAERVIKHRNTPEAWNQKAMRTLQQRLKLSPEQDLKMRRILDGGIEEMKGIRRETIAKTDAVVVRMLADFEKEITPEQRAEFEKLRQQRGATTLDMLKVEPRKK
jgi:Spy/CpxP family protein refolding chaperone